MDRNSVMKFRSGVGRAAWFGPIGSALSKSGLRLIAHESTYMFYPNDGSRADGNRHYIYKPATGWTASGSTISGTMLTTGAISGGVGVHHLVPPTTTEHYTLLWSNSGAPVVVFSIGFNRALTAAERSALGASAFWSQLIAGTGLDVANILIAAIPSTPYLYYDFVQGADATVVYDRSGNSRNGEFINTNRYWSSRGLWCETGNYARTASNLGISGNAAVSLVTHSVLTYGEQISGIASIGSGVAASRFGQVTTLIQTGKVVKYYAGTTGNGNAVVNGVPMNLVLTHAIDDTTGADCKAKTLFYRDGVLVDPAESAPATGLSLADAKAQFAELHTNGYTGNIQLRAAAIYDRVLSATEVTQLMGYMRINHALPYRIFFDGDSICGGAGIRGSQAWPWQTIKSIDSTLPWSSNCTGGAKWAGIITNALTRIDPYLDSNSIVVVMCGANDGTRTGANLWSDAQSYCNSRKALGARVILCTTIPTNLQNNDARKDFNTLVRAGYAALGVSLADVAAAAEFSADDAYNDTTYYQGDKIHLTAAGNVAIAAVVSPVLSAML